MSPLEKILFNWLIYTCAVTITAYLLPGVVISGLFAAMVTALVLGFINTIIKPILVVLTLPITILTLGIFALLINAFLVLLAARIVPGFYISGFGSALLFSLVLTLANWFLNKLGEK